MAMLTYKGYSAVLEVDLEAGELFGRTVGMRDIITFQGKTIEEARRSFEESVDFYLECCREERKKPDRPYSGRFNVRITPELHRRLAILAESQGQSLNELVSATLSTVTGEVPIQPNVPEPTWQEVKAKLEAKRAEEAPTCGASISLPGLEVSGVPGVTSASPGTPANRPPAAPSGRGARARA